jgi:hypothetical protein
MRKNVSSYDLRFSFYQRGRVLAIAALPGSTPFGRDHEFQLQ